MRRILTDMTKLIGSLLLIIGVFLAGNLGTLLSMTERDPIYYQTLPVGLNKDMYYQGDDMVMLIDRCNTTGKDIHFVVTREFYNIDNGDRVIAPGGIGYQPPACTQQQVQLVSPFPPQMDEGRYILRGGTRIQGQWKEVTLTWASRPFEYKKIREGT